MQRSLEDVKQQLKELKPTLRKRFKVETIDIFGSHNWLVSFVGVGLGKAKVKVLK
jgi:hypothetical protein